MSQTWCEGTRACTHRRMVAHDLLACIWPTLTNAPLCHQDFVISTIDRPMDLVINASGNDLPVFRFCKGDSFADVLIPMHHFNMKR